MSDEHKYYVVPEAGYGDGKELVFQSTGDDDLDLHISHILKLMRDRFLSVGWNGKTEEAAQSEARSIMERELQGTPLKEFMFHDRPDCVLAIPIENLTCCGIDLAQRNSPAVAVLELDWSNHDKTMAAVHALYGKGAMTRKEMLALLEGQS